MSDLDDKLLQRAAEVRRQAYAPYSKYTVGAALLADSGEIFSGCNVENASYGLTICAERNAVFAAVAAGQTKFEKIALSLADAGTPCGACRQVLNEFAPELVILLGDENGKLLGTRTLCELLPDAFGPANLKPKPDSK
jgi:cytidine deaminase